MLKSSQRLTTKQFDEIMKKGRVLSSSLFLLRYTNANAETHIGAVAPSKTFKTAVERNANRRKIYNSLKPILEKIKPGIHAAIFAKISLEKTSTETIKNELISLFNRISV